MSRVRSAAMALGGILLTVGGLRWWFAAPPDDPKLLANRVWAERARRDDRDAVLYLVPIEVGRKRVGSIQRASRFAFSGEVFEWSRDEKTLTLKLPQQGRAVTVGVRTWACGAEAPEGFDLCLELSQGEQRQRLYSRKGWVVPRGEDLPLAVPDLPALDDPCTGCTSGSLDTIFGR